MENVLDYSLGLFTNEQALQDVYRHVESVIDMEPASSELRKKMLAEFRAFKIANQWFGMLLMQQDRRIFWKVVAVKS
jgi:hypothetical protein